MDDDQKPAFLDYDETIAYMGGGLSRSTIKNLAARGEIVKVHVGTRAMFVRSSVDAYIRRTIDTAIGDAVEA